MYRQIYELSRALSRPQHLPDLGNYSQTPHPMQRYESLFGHQPKFWLNRLEAIFIPYVLNTQAVYIPPSKFAGLFGTVEGWNIEQWIRLRLFRNQSIMPV